MLRTKRLTAADRELARRLFTVMAEAFEEDSEALGDAHLDRLLGRAEFWAIAALVGEEVVGGLTAHTLPMTRSESFEVFIYDVAVRADHRRQGVGRALITALREAAAGLVVFVPADEDDVEALEFYRALGGTESRARFFTFSDGGR